MKIPRQLQLLRSFAAVLLTALLSASFSVARAESAADTKIQDEIVELKTTYENAINRGDLAPLEKLFDDGTSGVTVDNQSFKTFADLKAIYDRFHASFPGVVYRIKLNYEPTQIFGEVVVLHGTCDEYVKTSEGEFNYTSSWTAALHKAGGSWKLVRSQVTMDPFHNSIVERLRSKTKLYYGVGALLAGLFVGVLSSRIVAPPRRKTAI